LSTKSEIPISTSEFPRIPSIVIFRKEDAKELLTWIYDHGHSYCNFSREQALEHMYPAFSMGTDERTRLATELAITIEENDQMCWCWKEYYDGSTLPRYRFAPTEKMFHEKDFTSFFEAP